VSRCATLNSASRRYIANRPCPAMRGQDQVGVLETAIARLAVAVPSAVMDLFIECAIDEILVESARSTTQEGLVLRWPMLMSCLRNKLIRSTRQREVIILVG
jgi:hypothetical protein